MKSTEMIDLCGVYHQSLRFLRGPLLVLHQPFMTDAEENFVLSEKHATYPHTLLEQLSLFIYDRAFHEHLLGECMFHSEP